MNIFLVTDITGFPYGTAAANRIMMMGKAFIEGGNTFTVLTNTPYYNALNKAVKGQSESINYKYLGNTTHLKKSKFILILILLKGYIHLFLSIAKMNKKKDMVYIYSQGRIFNVITLLFCKLNGIKIIQEVNEWYFKQIGKNFAAFITEKIALKYSTGVVAISSTIKNEVLQVNPHLKTIVIPALENSDNFRQNKNMEVNTHDKYCFWMGLINAYINDIIFIIKGLALAYNNGQKFNLYITGKYDEITKKKLKKVCAKYNYPFNCIKMLGYLDDEALKQYCQNAFFYILPLWDDMRSNARFPTKLASFLFSGKPVITAKIGDVGKLLTHKKNVIYYNVNDHKHLAKQIELLQDNELYNTLCKESIIFAQTHFNYKAYSNPLNEFVNAI
jgi:glycosyltransferase involved in cell wall biosynthesis